LSSSLPTFSPLGMKNEVEKREKKEEQSPISPFVCPEKTREGEKGKGKKTGGEEREKKRKGGRKDNGKVDLLKLLGVRKRVARNQKRKESALPLNFLMKKEEKGGNRAKEER